MSFFLTDRLLPLRFRHMHQANNAPQGHSSRGAFQLLGGRALLTRALPTHAAAFIASLSKRCRTTIPIVHRRPPIYPSKIQRSSLVGHSNPPPRGPPIRKHPHSPHYPLNPMAAMTALASNLFCCTNHPHFQLFFALSRSTLFCRL